MVESNSGNWMWLWWCLMVAVNIVQVVVGVRLYRQSLLKFTDETARILLARTGSVPLLPEIISNRG